MARCLAHPSCWSDRSTHLFFVSPSSPQWMPWENFSGAYFLWKLSGSDDTKQEWLKGASKLRRGGGLSAGAQLIQCNWTGHLPLLGCVGHERKGAQQMCWNFPEKILAVLLTLAGGIDHRARARTSSRLGHSWATQTALSSDGW